jgi:hypothetical protein
MTISPICKVLNGIDNQLKIMKIKTTLKIEWFNDYIFKELNLSERIKEPLAEDRANL